MGCVSVFEMNGDSPDKVADKIIEEYSLTPRPDKE